MGVLCFNGYECLVTNSIIIIPWCYFGPLYWSLTLETCNSPPSFCISHNFLNSALQYYVLSQRKEFDFRVWFLHPWLSTINNTLPESPDNNLPNTILWTFSWGWKYNLLLQQSYQIVPLLFIFIRAHDLSWFLVLATLYLLTDSWYYCSTAI